MNFLLGLRPSQKIGHFLLLCALVSSFYFEIEFVVEVPLFHSTDAKMYCSIVQKYCSFVILLESRSLTARRNLSPFFNSCALSFFQVTWYWGVGTVLDADYSKVCRCAGLCLWMQAALCRCDHASLSIVTFSLILQMPTIVIHTFFVTVH